MKVRYFINYFEFLSNTKHYDWYLDAIKLIRDNPKRQDITKLFIATQVHTSLALLELGKAMSDQLKTTTTNDQNLKACCEPSLYLVTVQRKK